MNNLKTLKDLGYVWVTDNPETNEGHYQKSPIGIFCKSEELRQEVIKHIKSGKMVEGAKYWAIEFFNIKESDLQ